MTPAIFNALHALGSALACAVLLVVLAGATAAVGYIACFLLPKRIQRAFHLWVVGRQMAALERRGTHRFEPSRGHRE